jgi:hypothetical protein
MGLNKTVTVTSAYDMTSIAYVSSPECPIAIDHTSATTFDVISSATEACQANVRMTVTSDVGAGVVEIPINLVVNVRGSANETALGLDASGDADNVPVRIEALQTGTDARMLEMNTDAVLSIVSTSTPQVRIGYGVGGSTPTSYADLFVGSTNEFSIGLPTLHKEFSQGAGTYIFSDVSLDRLWAQDPVLIHNSVDGAGVSLTVSGGPSQTAAMQKWCQFTGINDYSEDRCGTTPDAQVTIDGYAYFPLVGVGSATPTSATCVSASSDRAYGDKDCDNTKDGGEEFFDRTPTEQGLLIGTNVQAYDADLDDLADGLLTSSKVGAGTNCYSWNSRFFNPAENATNYVSMALGTITGPGVTETTYDQAIAPVSMKFTGLAVLVDVAPGGSDTWIVTVRDDAADISGTSATCTITGAETTCSWSGTSGTVAQFSKLDLKVVGSATAATAGEMIVSWCTAP